MSQGRIRSKFTIRDTDPLVRCHRVEEIHILPGVAMLDAVYKTFAAAHIDGARLALTDIRFHEPVVTNAATDRKVTVTLERAGTGGRISVTSLPCPARPVASDLAPAATTHMTCGWRAAAPLHAEAPTPAPTTVGAAVDLDACYAVTRRIGINHDGFMKCRGQLGAFAPSGFGGRIELPPEALARAGEFLIHPVFLDASTIVPLFHLRTRLDEASLFIPFAIEEFQALPLTGHAALDVRVEAPAADIDGREVVSHSFALFDRDGRPLVRLRNFTVKRVRSLAGIRRLLQPAAVAAQANAGVPAQADNGVGTGVGTGTGIAVAVTVAVAREGDAGAGGGDALVALIGALLGRQGGLVWTEAAASTAFFDLGLDSLALLEASEALEKRLGVRLYPTVLFENPNATALAAYLRAEFPAACAAVAAPVAAGGDVIVDLIADLIGKHRGRAFTPGELATPFFDLGLDSLALLELSEVLEKRLAVRLYPTVLFERPHVSALVAYLRQDFPEACAEYAATAATRAHARPAPSGARAPNPAPAPTSPAAPTPASASPPRALSLAPQPEVLVPRWVPAPAPAPDPARGQAIALVSGPDDAGLGARLARALAARVAFVGDGQAMAAALATDLVCDEIWLCNADHAAAFAITKVLIATGRTRGPLVVKAITLDAFGLHGAAADPDAAHGVWGFLQSLSREYPTVNVAAIDLSRAELAAAHKDADAGTDPSWLTTVLAQHPNRTLRASRGGRGYQRVLMRAQDSMATPVGFRRGGVYLVVGGAGGVGMELVRHLRTAHAAKVAVLGRRPLDAGLRAALAETGSYGIDVLYLRAAVDDQRALASALATVTHTLGDINGVVHSAMVLDDRRLAEMDQPTFERVLQPKVAGARALALATASLKLDFLLYFSSVQSFIGNLAQANYAAASTFLDGHAAALGARRPYPVVVVNWGFWGEVGAVASERYRQLMARQGVHGLQSRQAMAALEEILAAGWTQAAVIAADQPVLLEMGLQPASELRRIGTVAAVAPIVPGQPLAPEEIAMFAETRAANDRLLALARPRVRRILRELLAGRSPDEAVRAGAIAARQVELVRTLASLVGDDHPAAPDDTPAPDAAEFTNALAALVQELPAAGALAPLLAAAIDGYPRVLSGRLPAPAALFPGGSAALVRAVYAESAVSAFYNRRLAHAVAALPGAPAAEPGRPLRILEIGGGTGATTEAVLAALADAGRPCAYVYTDLWDKLVNETRERLGPVHPQLRFAFLDIGADPASQGFDENGHGTGFDVVIATNVLHATRDLHQSLRHAKQLLRAGGALLVNESVEVQEYSTYTFGLLPGWWHAADPHERVAGSPLASATRWPGLLAEEGFLHARGLVPPCPAAPDAGAQQIYLAVSDGALELPARPRRPAPPALPPALAELRPFTLPGAPANRHLRTCEDARGHLWVFLDNPPANTFTDELLDELCATLPALAAAPDRGRIIYLSHLGDYFSLGGDRSEIVRRLAAGDHDGITAFGHKASNLIRVITSLDALVVAVVNGTAQGGGLETLFATDLQIVRSGVKLGLPEVKSGLVPGMGGLSYLKDLIGAPRTKRLVMQGGLISAEEALAMGMVSQVAEDPFAAALNLGEELRQLNPALYMKKLLAPEIGARLTADIEAWITYLKQHTDWIDATRIANSRLLVAGRAAAWGAGDKSARTG